MKPRRHMLHFVYTRMREGDLCMTHLYAALHHTTCACYIALPPPDILYCLKLFDARASDSAYQKERLSEM